MEVDGLPSPAKTIMSDCTLDATHGTCLHYLERNGEYHYYRCSKCRSANVSKGRRRKKQLLISELGGVCEICGYSKCPSALVFHHVDPATKEFSLGLTGGSRSLEALKKEASKCALLCANCHQEVHAGVTPIRKKRFYLNSKTMLTPAEEQIADMLQRTFDFMQDMKDNPDFDEGPIRYMDLTIKWYPPSDSHPLNPEDGAAHVSTDMSTLHVYNARYQQWLSMALSEVGLVDPGVNKNVP